MLLILIIATFLNLALLMVILKRTRVFAESTEAALAALEQVSSDVLSVRENGFEEVNINVLGREWHGSEWPRRLSSREQQVLHGAFTQDGLPRLPNPAPFENGDDYACHLLTSRFSAFDGYHRIKLLEQL